MFQHAAISGSLRLCGDGGAFGGHAMALPPAAFPDQRLVVLSIW
jgi:hypothetical protein